MADRICVSCGDTIVMRQASSQRVCNECQLIAPRDVVTHLSVDPSRRLHEGLKMMFPNGE